MDFEKWEYGDPENVAARREAQRQRQDQQCGSCIHRVEKAVRREIVSVCHFRRRTYGVRCELHELNTVVAWEDLCK
jgi:hypothetical protein